MIVKSGRQHCLITYRYVSPVHLPYSILFHSICLHPKESFLSILYHILFAYYFNGLNADLVWWEGSLCSHLRGQGSSKTKRSRPGISRNIEESLEKAKKIERIIQDHSKELV